MTIPLPFLHSWRRMIWAGTSPFRYRVCRICGRHEVYAYYSWNKVTPHSLTPVVNANREWTGPA